MSDQTTETEELRKRIAAARKQKQELEEKRAALLESPAELAKEAARMERSAKDAEKLLELETQHGKERIGYINTDLGMVILSRPNPTLFRKFQDEEKVNTLVAEKLVRPCVLHPSKDQFDMMCEEQPMILSRAAERVAKLAGLREKEIEGK